MENFTCAKPVRGSGATREPTGQICVYDYAVPVCKKGRPNCGGPSEEGKRPAGDDGRSHSKASKPLRCCDTRHCGRHGTRSSLIATALLLLLLSRNGRRRSYASPGIVCLLLRDLFSRGFIVLIDLLLLFLFFRRQLTLLFP